MKMVIGGLTTGARLGGKDNSGDGQLDFNQLVVRAWEDRSRGEFGSQGRLVGAGFWKGWSVVLRAPGSVVSKHDLF